MTAREYLGQAYRLEKRIEMHRQEIERLRELGSSVSSPGFGERVQTSQKADAPFVNVILKIMEAERKEASMLEQLFTFKQEISDVIEQIPDIDERMVLRERYISNKTWVQIGDLLGWDERTIRRIHNKACAHIVLPKKPTKIW